MPYCPRCGSEVESDAKFCPKCGSRLTVVPTVTASTEKSEKKEKEEKEEKEEKYEKREVSTLFQLAFGLILVFLGLLVFISAFNLFSFRLIWAYFLLAVGIIIIIFAAASARTAIKRNPKP